MRALFVALLLTGCGGRSPEVPRNCTPGTDPVPGCSTGECFENRDMCEGKAYFCDDTGQTAWAYCDCPMQVYCEGEACTDDDPVPGCTWWECIDGENGCLGLVYQCVEGRIVITQCHESPPDAQVPDAPPIDGGVVDTGTIDVPFTPVDAGLPDAAVSP